MMIKRAQRSGCKNTSITGIIMETIKGIKPCCVSESACLCRAQKEATVRMIESLRNSVGWSAKGSHGTSNHHRAPLILIPKIRTPISITITTVAIHFVYFFHQIWGILIATTIAARPIPICMIFRIIKRQLFGASRVPDSTSFRVIR